MRLYLDALPERSFAQSFRNRKDRRGFMGDVTPTERQVPAGDMFKAYRDRAYNISHQVARVKYGAQINAFQTMLNQEKEALDTKDIPQEEKALNQLYIEELEARAQWAANPVVQNWAKVATGIGFNATLGLNLSSALVNLSQLPMVTLPYLGGQYGFVEATKAMGRASKLFMASGRKRGVDSYGVEVGEDIQSKQGALWSLDNYDFSDPNLPPEIKQYETLVKVASELGQLNRSIAYDILDLGDITNPMAKINAVTGFFFHHGERMNRQISMAAAYDLALNKMKSDGRKIDEAARQEAAIEAINVTEMTNGGIAAASAPRFAQDGLGKVVFLFKRYASAIYFILGSLAYRSIKGSDADRAMARRQLAGVFGGAGLVAGIQGLPLFGVLAMMHDIFKDDDEEDFETSVRKYFNEGMYGGLGNYLFGVDVASRMGLSNLVFRDRLIEKDQSILWTTAEMLGGPVVGTALQVERGFDQIADGEVARGVETAMPAAIRNIMKSGRFATEGAKTLRGDPIVEDIGPWNLIAQAAGFAPSDYTLQLQKNAQVKKIDRAVNEE
ncbi:MAG: PLxRFG domain-containing protein, partial [Opitutae bacterium]